MDTAFVERRRAANAPLVDRRSTNTAFVERRRRIAERRRRRKPVPLPQQAFTPIAYRGLNDAKTGHDWLLALAETVANPLALAASLFAVTLLVHGKISTQHLYLAIIVFALTFRDTLHLTKTIAGVARHIVASWLVIAGVLLVVGWVTGALAYFDHALLVGWGCAAPLSLFAVQLLLRFSKPAIARLQGPPERAVVVGANEQGLELARRIGELPTHLRILGFFDDRPEAELSMPNNCPVLGKLQDLPRFANDHKINRIYISLPMVHQPRIQALLDGLRDTTASVYFVPNIFVTDLIQGRVDSVHGLPVVAVCDTPFTGLDGLIKRVSDFVLALIILILLSPLMLAIALGVKLSSPGPVIFRQRRYGLDGKDIGVYKFRSMTVAEDGDLIQQARKQDPRVTRFGAFLRRSSLDELPQFFNVLQGRMSIVGPRPHAVAHNEMYRKVIDGYMIRHKVRPGITGWAQVNGLRGETDTLQKMRERVRFDLDYLRNWSLRLDAYIIAKTVWVVLRGDNAY